MIHKKIKKSKNNCMKKKIFLILIIVFCINMSSCQNITKNSDVKKTRTIMIYMNGSDLETKNGLASEDIREIEKVNFSDNTKVLIETGGTKKWHNKNIDNTINERFEIKNHKLTLIEKLDERNMGKSDTLSDFLNFCFNYNKSDEYVLIFWNHGAGAVSGFGKDENFDEDTLLLKEMRSAFEESYKINKKVIDLVVFDACLMGSYETANILSKYAKYMVASEELVYGFGFNYKKIFKKNDSNIIDLGKRFVNTYYNESLLKGKNAITTMSLLNLENIKSLNEAFEEKIKNVEMGSFSQSAFESISYGGRTKEEGFSNMIDLGGLLEYKEDEVVMNAFNDVVLYKKNGYINKNSSGISIYFPKENKDRWFNEYLLYKDLDISTNYSKLIFSYITNAKEKKKEKEVFFVNGKRHVGYRLNDDEYTINYKYKGANGNIRVLVEEDNVNVLGFLVGKNKPVAVEDKIMECNVRVEKGRGGG